MTAGPNEWAPAHDSVCSTRRDVLENVGVCSADAVVHVCERDRPSVAVELNGEQILPDDEVVWILGIAAKFVAQCCHLLEG